jgi:hypothetical protein
VAAPPAHKESADEQACSNNGSLWHLYDFETAIKLSVRVLIYVFTAQGAVALASELPALFPDQSIYESGQVAFNFFAYFTNHPESFP